MPIALPPAGLAGCAQTGAANASAATTATPVRRCFMVLILFGNPSAAVEVPTKAQLAFIILRVSGVKTARGLATELRRSGRSRRIDGAAQRHLSVAHFYVHSQQCAHTEQWFRHRPGHDHRFYIVQDTGADLKPPQPKKRNWVIGSISG